MVTLSNSSQKPGKSLWFFVCLLILAGGVGSFIILKALKPAPEQIKQALLVPSVQTTPLEYRHSPLLIEGNGIVIPRAEISLASQVNGEVVNIHQNLVTGGALAEGEVIIQIDPRSFAANLAEAEANQTANMSTLSFINKQIERLESLLTDGFTGAEDMDDALNRRDQTLAAIARQNAIIDNRKLELERTAIKAPFSGRIISENVDIGDIVSPGRELARFYASDAVEIVTALSPDDSRFIPGLWNNTSDNHRRAWVTVNHGGLVYQWEAYVDRVEADIDRVTRTVDVVVRVPNPFIPGSLISHNESSIVVEPPPLLVGMYSTVAIEGINVKNNFVLPVNALRSNNTIWVAKSEGFLSIEAVELIRQEGNQVVLLAPQLSEGSQIIISNIALVSDGMRIKVANIMQGENSQ